MPDWSIKIVPAANGKPAAFVPDLRGAQPGATLVTQVDDIVTWNNTTGEAFWPWPTDSTGKILPDDKVSTEFGNYLSNKIPAGESSTPYFNPIAIGTTAYTITYCCKLHPTITGAIAVNPIPT
jgi:hypothetical protein